MIINYLKRVRYSLIMEIIILENLLMEIKKVMDGLYMKMELNMKDNLKIINMMGMVN